MTWRGSSPRNGWKPFAADWDREHRFPAEAIREMADLGFLGMLVPEEWGGAQTGHLAYAMALEEIAAGDGACSTIMSVHNSVGCMPIHKFGSAEQKERFLRPLAQGSMLGAFALTEPQAGSDASFLKTRARRDGDHYVLNGAKQFITSGSHAGMVIVFAVTDPDAGKRGISAFIVPTDTPGYEVVRIEGQARPARLGHLPAGLQRPAYPGHAALWARRARATASPWPTSKAAASASPPRRSAWRARRSRRRATTPMSGKPSASRSSSTRRWPSAWPTWPPASPWRGRWSTTPPACAKPACRA